MSTTKTQSTQILRHLKRKSITTMDAFNLYGITRLAARIYDLKEDGRTITAERVTKAGVRFDKYSLG
jgi:uncharacterized small protein (DUF1192 family)